jgi:hypothetical protein
MNEVEVKRGRHFGFSADSQGVAKLAAFTIMAIPPFIRDMKTYSPPNSKEAHKASHSYKWYRYR